VVVVAGATGSGKSRLALELARKFGGEIVNCDSLQLYRGFDIGTAKLGPAERQGIPHHLIDVLEPHQVFTAGDFAVLAASTLAAVTGRGRLPILAGGTGFYLRALFDGLAAAPKRDEGLRKRLAAWEARRPAFLHRLLTKLDAGTARRIHPRDINKLIRALEITILARRPASQVFESGKTPLEGYSALKILLDPPRDTLREALAKRTRQLFERGLPEEVARLLAQGVPESVKPFESIGYRECRDYLAGRIGLQRAMELTFFATCQYAKRQRAWFRREAGMRILPGFGHEIPVQDQASEMVRAHVDRFS
jgi:tRNA dimethylallyltransferase